MNTKFLITKNDTFFEYQIFDREKKEIWRMEYNGKLENITNECLRTYKNNAEKPYDKRKLGGIYYQFLNNDASMEKACIFDDDIFLQTNSRNKFEKTIIKEHNSCIEKLCEKIYKRDERIKNLLKQIEVLNKEGVTKK